MSKSSKRRIRAFILLVPCLALGLIACGCLALGEFIDSFKQFTKYTGQSKHQFYIETTEKIEVQA